VHCAVVNDWYRVTIAAIGPRSAQLAIYDAERDRWAIQNLRAEDDGLKMIRVSMGFPELLAYAFAGPRLTQIAVFDRGRFQWSVRELDEPWAGGSAEPFNGEHLAVYPLGRHLYAYSSVAGRWDTLELEKPVDVPVAALRIVGDVAAISQGGRLHVFTASEGRWQTAKPKE
jgi:hypothetical protein